MGSTARPKHEISDTARIAASPARDCGPSCPRSSADEEGSSWPSGAPVLKRGDATIPILSGRTLQLSTLDARPAQRVRSIPGRHRRNPHSIKAGRPRQIRQNAVYNPAMTQASTIARLEARLPAEVMAVLKRAAEIEGRTLTDFVVAAAHEAAKRTIEDSEVIRLSVEDSRRFAEAFLDPPEPALALRRAGERYRKLNAGREA